MTKGYLFAIGLIMIIMLISSCENQPMLPRPAGYFRIDLPEHKYQPFDFTFPYYFKYSQSARIQFDNYTSDDPFWLNIYYPKYKARIHLSYKSLKDNKLFNLTEDARNFVFRHAEKAQGIKENTIKINESKMFGLVYRIEGKEVASPFQFWVSDSSTHFLRGALYFSVRPNNDSLEPVINFIVKDIDHLLSTLEWR